MPYGAMTIANWFVAWAEAEEADLSNLKLQKLLYYAQGHHLANSGNPLFRDSIEAWSHGPVVPDVYHHWKYRGSADLRLPRNDPFRWEDVDERTDELLVKIWNTYGCYSAWKLRTMTHNEPPWHGSFKPGVPHLEITKRAMKDYFSSLPR